MPAVIPVALAVTAAAGIYGAVNANQQAQHAKGAAEAQQTQMDAQIKAADVQTKTKQTQQSATSQAGAAQKMAAMLASMTQMGGDSGTITGASTMAPAQTQQKTLLGT